ncbi:prepilin-type N-terminal cleavage/methylation domain-containing protein [Frigoriglobus tundricola]|uniref:General secretion pathway GspH domain-containing protein n=1 Tax=Frigoriglobus tundricola TaxID=2774151 RepID=A0A6M5YUU4_9BACT|nr:prepilin-type N-terminal cleavage/methylation domain-containing protein [Frigoriglobus tundricola]QJW97190.1 hypothetical protein FTUN_4755 [Frigoriglobus tundricola]
MTARNTRRGYTLFEVLVVLALLILMTALVLPSAEAIRSGPRQRAAADVIRGELAIARSRAMEEGRPYRVALSSDNTRIRRAPDDENFAQAAASSVAGGSATVVDYPFDHVTAVRVADQNAQPPNSTDGWVTIASVQPDGSCLEDSVLISIQENNVPGLYVRVRGLTGSSRVVPSGSVNGGAQ